MIAARTSALGRAAELRGAFDQTFAELPHAETQDVEDLLGIRVGGDRYAFRLGEISGLFADRKIVTVPSPVPELLGVSGFRGGLVPIYSLRDLLGYPAASESSRWIILAGAGHPIGLAFDHFEAYLRVRRSELTTAQDAESRRHIRETARLADGLRAIISVHSVIDTIKERIGVAGTIAVDTIKEQ